jgi:hypothetical protein
LHRVEKSAVGREERQDRKADRQSLDVGPCFAGVQSQIHLLVLVLKRNLETERKETVVFYFFETAERDGRKAPGGERLIKQVADVLKKRREDPLVFFSGITAW